MSKKQVYILIALGLAAVAGAMKLYGFDYWGIVLGLGLVALLNAFFDPRGRKADSGDKDR